MLKIEERMKEKGLTYYAINKALNRDLRGGFNLTKKQLNGFAAMKYQTYQTILEILDLEEKDVPFNIIELKVEQI